MLSIAKSDISDNELIDDDTQEMDQFYDTEYARMSAKISKTRNNTQRFDRINVSNKFNITMKTEDDTNNTKSSYITYLDSIYVKLRKIGIHGQVIEKLANLLLNKLF